MVERVPLTDALLDEWEAADWTGTEAGLCISILIAELRASRAELAVLRPALRRVKQRIGRLLAEMDQEEADALEVQAGEYAGTFIETTRVRAVLTGSGTAEPGRPVTHLALIQGSLPPGLTEVAGGTEQHCRAQLERWVTEHGLRDGERALILGLVAETVAEPGVGIYTAPTDRP